MTSDGFSSSLRDSDIHVAVTGASGWLGQASLALLAEVFGGDFADRTHAFGSSVRSYEFSGRSITSTTLRDLDRLPPRPILWLHYAFLTKDRVAKMSAQDYVRANGEISQAVAAAAERCHTAGIFVPSSGAVYGPDRSLFDDLEANPYGALKLADERRFSRLAQDRAVPLVITRVFNLAGPYINKVSVYALASILTDLLQDKPVTLRADHPVIRSYVHINDLIKLVLGQLLQPSPPREPLAFDTAGEIEVEVGDLARMAAEIVGKPQAEIARPPVKESPVNRYVGDGRLMAELAASAGLRLSPLAEQIADTAAHLQRL